jgi:hypothetical protein
VSQAVQTNPNGTAIPTLYHFNQFECHVHLVCNLSHVMASQAPSGQYFVVKYINLSGTSLFWENFYPKKEGVQMFKMSFMVMLSQAV